jgi:hypothetical protein
VFAVVLLTGTGLRVELYHWGQLTELAGEAQRTLTPVAVEPIDTSGAVLAQIVRTVVVIVRTVVSTESFATNALIVCPMIHTLSTIFTRVVLFMAKLDLCFAILSAKTGQTVTPIGLDLVDTRAVVLAFIGQTIVYIGLTSVAIKACDKTIVTNIYQSYNYSNIEWPMVTHREDNDN